MQQNYRLVKLATRHDSRGGTDFLDKDERLPFAPQRIFVIHDVPPGGTRGGHAHRRQHQLFLMVEGTCTATIDDGRSCSVERLAAGEQALYLPPLNWLTLSELSPGAICVALASDSYDEGEYIVDHDEFVALAVAAQ